MSHDVYGTQRDPLLDRARCPICAWAGTYEDCPQQEFRQHNTYHELFICPECREVVVDDDE